MPSLLARAFRFYIKWILRSKTIMSNATAMQKTLHSLYIRPQSFNPPTNLGNNIFIDRVDLNAWPLYRVSAVGRGSSSNQPNDQKRDAMLYIHGGSFVHDISSLHWQFIAQVACETNLDVLVPIYPLLPRPVSSAAQLNQGLIEICRKSEQTIVCIGGDSAGGMLSIAMAQQLQKTAPELAARLRCLVLISPVLDCSLSHPEVVRLEKDDPWLGIEGLKVLMPMLADGLPMNDPIVSPLYGDIDNLPPIIMTSGTSDMLCADARRLSGKFQGKGTEEPLSGSFHNEKLTFIEKADMIHVYALLQNPEGAEARELIMHFINKY